MSGDVQIKPPMDLASQEFQKAVNEGMKNWSVAADEINRMTERRHRKIPEPYFKTHVLPFVRAWMINDPENPPEIGYWLNIADGLNNEISVTDENGEVLFKVPPPFCDIPMRTVPPETRRLVTVHNLVAVQGDMYDNGDQRGFWEIERQLVDICSPRPLDEDKTRYLTMLIRIWDRYDLPLEEIVGGMADEIRAVLKSNNAAATGSKKVEMRANETEAEDDCIY